MSDGCSDDHGHHHIDDGDVHYHQCDHNTNGQLDQHIDVNVDKHKGWLLVVALCQRRDMHRLYAAVLAAMQCVALRVS